MNPSAEKAFGPLILSVTGVMVLRAAWSFHSSDPIIAIIGLLIGLWWLSLGIALFFAYRKL